MKHGGRRGNASARQDGRIDRLPEAEGKRSVMRSVVMILAEILLTVGVVCALYVVWMQWWTGVQSENRQIEERQSVGWAQPASDGANAKIAQPQQGDPPLQPEHASIGELIGRVYIPRFGNAWERNLVQGTELAELNLHGLGHYVDSQMPGQVGNFAIAGHRNGYGQPLGDVDKLQPGDAVVVRTKDYWYVYTYTNYTIVTPDETSVISANPEDPSAPPTKRMLTMTTCEPKYTAPTHRWISFGEFKYWAKVSDGVPAELATKGADGATKFISNEQTPFFAKLKTLQPVIWGRSSRTRSSSSRRRSCWRWPLLRAIREGRRPRPDVDIYGVLVRHQWGPRRFAGCSRCCCSWPCRSRSSNGRAHGRRAISRYCAKCRTTRRWTPSRANAGCLPVESGQTQ